MPISKEAREVEDEQPAGRNCLRQHVCLGWWADRARVVTIEKVTVDYINFSNTEVVGVEDVYELPSCVGDDCSSIRGSSVGQKQKTQEVLEVKIRCALVGG